MKSRTVLIDALKAGIFEPVLALLSSGIDERRFDSLPFILLRIESRSGVIMLFKFFVTNWNLLFVFR